jgi:hypothetical protein
MSENRGPREAKNEPETKFQLPLGHFKHLMDILGALKGNW